MTNTLSDYSTKHLINELERRISLLESENKYLKEKINHSDKIKSINDTDITLAYNALNSISGFNAKTARDEFISKFKVKAFRCVNFNELMNNPTDTPQFADALSVQSGDYWSIPIDEKKFAVVPNVKTYTDNHHFARAMRQVFKSNFITGTTYTTIEVKHPAIFNCDNSHWHLIKQGEIILK